jgi:hypothetical protein
LLRLLLSLLLSLLLLLLPQQRRILVRTCSRCHARRKPLRSATSSGSVHSVLSLGHHNPSEVLCGELPGLLWAQTRVLRLELNLQLVKLVRDAW